MALDGINVKLSKARVKKNSVPYCGPWRGLIMSVFLKNKISAPILHCRLKQCEYPAESTVRGLLLHFLIGWVEAVQSAVMTKEGTVSER